MKSHRRTSSMFQLPAERPQYSRSLSNKQEQARQPRHKADELENQRPQSSGRRIHSARVSRLGDARLGSAPEVVDEMPLRSFREPTIGLVEYDGDLLLNMVDNLQINMKQSLLGSTKGRFYDRYMVRRHAKLRQERGSSEWARKRERMEAMEDTFEKTSTEMKNRCWDPSDKKTSVLRGPLLLRKQRSFSIGSTIELKKKLVVEDIAEPSQSDEHKSLGTFLMDDSAEFYNSSKLLSGKGLYSTTSPNSTAPIHRSSRSCYSCSTKQTADSADPLVQMTVESSDLTRVNLKPHARIGKVATRSDSVTFDRSKSTAAGTDIFKEEKQLRFRHMRNSSVTFGELKEFVPVNSNSSKPTLSSYPKDQSDNTVSKKVQFDRSKSTAAGTDTFKEEKQLRFRHMRNSSVTFGELKEFVPVNFNSSNPTLSSYPKDQIDNTISKKVQFGGESKPFLRRGGGKRPGLATAVTKSRASNASDSWSKKENDVVLINQQEYSADMIGNRDEEFQRRWGKLRGYIVPSELNSEEERSSNVGSSGDITFVDEDNISSGFTSNFDESPRSDPSCSSAHEASDSGVFMSMGTPIGNKHHLNLMREADATRVRKKWGSVEKPKFATNDSEQPLKDVGKILKKMLSFGSKRKNAERRVNNLLTIPTSSEGGIDTAEYSDIGKQSLHELSKPRKTYLGSSNIALHDDRIFLGKVPDSCVSCSSFNRRGNALKA